MAEYIEKKEAVEKILKIGKENYAGKYPQIGTVHAAQIVKRIQAADVAPVVHGRWLPVNGHWGPKIVRRGYQCSLCGRIENQREPYCHCGAKMDLRGENDDGSEKA